MISASGAWKQKRLCELRCCPVVVAVAVVTFATIALYCIASYIVRIIIITWKRLNSSFERSDHDRTDRFLHLRRYSIC